MDKVSMSYLFSFSRYQTKCFFKFLFRLLMMSYKIYVGSSSKGMADGRKEGADGIQKFKYLQNEKRFLDEIKIPLES